MKWAKTLNAKPVAESSMKGYKIMRIGSDYGNV
jgi:hypothetical protein